MFSSGPAQANLLPASVRARLRGPLVNFYQRGVDPVTVGKRYKYFLDGALGQFTGKNG